MTHRNPKSGKPDPHGEWLALVDIGGPFLSKPILAQTWPVGLVALTEDHREQLRSSRRHLDGVSWLRFLLTDLLEWGENLVWDGDSFRLLNAEGLPELLGRVDTVPPTARVDGDTVTPIDLIARACRESGVPLGLASDSRFIALVHAEPGQAVSHVVFDTVGWDEAVERPAVRAFMSLIGRRRFFAVPEEKRLPALFAKSRANQEELTEALGDQVRRATELLTEAIGRALPPESDVDAAEIYRASTVVLMRILFLLWAEEGGLMPSGNDLYADAYSATGLCDSLEKRANEGEALLEQSYAGWLRLQALFAAIARGSDHPALRMTAYDGSMFDPARYPWLEDQARPLAIDDRTVLHMLWSVMFVVVRKERRRLSFKSLYVEQIGYVYEGLLAFTAKRAAETTVRLAGRPGHEAEVTLDELEELAAGHPHDLPQALSERFHKRHGIGTPATVARNLAGTDALARTELLAATNGDHAETERLLPWHGLLHHDLRGFPSVIPGGGVFVTESSFRDDSGTHYTPPQLAAEIAEGTLSPLVHDPGPLQTADRSAWKVRPSEEILDLKVADIAMGSGALLVAAVRYLAEAVLKAWEHEGRGGGGPSGVDLEMDPQTITARRMVIERCVYGSDINPAAVELGKLSLWLISMDGAKPFTFLDDKLTAGDSLLGITRPEQLKYLHLDEDEGRRIHGDTLVDYTAEARGLLEKLADDRRAIAAIATDELPDVWRKRELLRHVRDATERVKGVADLVVDATLKASGSRSDEPYLEAAERLQRGEPANLRSRPLHWCLEYPEVFTRGGFDAVLDNPPYLGGQRLTGELGPEYREYLVRYLGRGVRGSADRAAYFLLRARELVKDDGQLGFVATNTLAQGATRRVGLDQVVADGTTIRAAVKSMPWPTRAAVEVCLVWISGAPVAEGGEWLVDRVPAPKGPTTSLDLVALKPFKLGENAGIAFQGAVILGTGFTMTREERGHLLAVDPKYEEVVHPYLNGKDLNSRPGATPSRWVIDFRDWTRERAAREYPLAFAQVERLVRPERERNPLRHRRTFWWCFAAPAKGLRTAIGDLRRVIALTRVSSVLQPVLVPARQVFADTVVVFASDDPALFAVLSGRAHRLWAVAHCSTMKTDTRYTPTSAFETFPLPALTPELRELGERLTEVQYGLMGERGIGLTALYNLVHGSSGDDEIKALRDLHRSIDERVAASYGWPPDLSDADLLARLHRLNHGRHGEETRSHRGKPPSPYPDLQPLVLPPQLPDDPHVPVGPVDAQRE